MTTISILILSIIAIALLPIAAAVIIRAIWEIIEVPYRLLMLAFYGTAYIVVTAYEVPAWSICLPFRIADWLSGHIHWR